MSGRREALRFTRFASRDAFGEGTFEDTAIAAGGDALTLAGADRGSWTGPDVQPGFAIDEVVASWNAHTPEGTSVEVEVRGLVDGGEETCWYSFGRWALDDGSFLRSSVAGQHDADGRLDVDTLVAARPLAGYRLRVRLEGAGGAGPTLQMVGAVAAGAGDGHTAQVAHDSAAGIELSVPACSQILHAGEHPELDNGGRSWCSAASTAMVLAFWGVGPNGEDLAWVAPSCPDPRVDHAARFCFDHGYGGAGNWPFNTAYAAQYGLDAFVTRLHSLREAEAFVAAGIPLVASIAAGPRELAGFPLSSGTTGHLLVIAGFTGDGDPVVFDPAAPSNETVRRVYDRSELERAWLVGSDGVVYVIRRPDVPLPVSPGNW